MNVLSEYSKVDKGYLDSLHKQGVINTSAYNMLNGGRTGYEEEEEDPLSRLSQKKKDKKSKKHRLDVRSVDDSAPPEQVRDDGVSKEPVNTNKVPEDQVNEGWNVISCPPSQRPKGECEKTQNAEDVGEREGKSGELESIDAAGWAFTWCFRCKRQDILKFGGKALPEWLVSNLNFEGDRGIPIVLMVCCVGCNNKHRFGSTSILEEERRMRQAFDTLRIDYDCMGEKALRIAAARVGRSVSMIQWDGRARSVDMEMMKKNLSPEDIAVSLSLEAYAEGKKGADLELGGLAGGLF